MPTRDYVLFQGRPVAVIVDPGVPLDAIQAEVARLYGGRWNVGRFVRTGRRRRVEFEERGRRRTAALDWWASP